MEPETPELLQKLKIMNDKANQFQWLESAIISGNGDRVIEALERDELNSAEKGRLLWVAVLRNETEIASMLLESGVDFNIRKPVDKLKSSFLHEFIKKGGKSYHQLAVTMMKQGANVNVPDDRFLRPLQYAIRAKTPTDVIRELLKHGARVDSSLIVEAAKHPNAAEVTALLVSGFVDNKTKSQRVDDTLFYCGHPRRAERNILPTVKLLLGMKVPVAELLMRRHTLLYAIRTKKIEMVQLLVMYGFEVNGPAPGSDSPLFAVEGCDGSLSNQLPLHIASISGRSAITKILIRAGAEVNARSSERSKEYAIHAACSHDSEENVQELLRHGADINSTNNRGRTPLFMIKFASSISSLHRKVLRYLAISTGKGIKINDCDLQMIEHYPAMFGYYTQCLDELEKMKVTKIMNKISFFTIFHEYSGELVFAMRKYDYEENNNRLQQRLEFPIYKEEIDFAFESVQTHNSMMSEKEKALCESLADILPYVPLEKVIYYMYLNGFK